LITEIQALRPQVIVFLGATAAQSLLGNAFRVTAHRGERLRLPAAIDLGAEPEPVVMATIHPSALLRDRTDRREQNYESFVADLRKAGSAL
jgi:DNA polymerase